MPPLTRREFLATGGFAALLAACGSSVPEALLAQARDATLPFSFTPDQRAALAAAVAQIVPRENADDWNAVDAGAVEYIEQLLNLFTGDGNPRLYGGGPTRDRFALFHKLSRIKQVAWMAEIARLRKVYADGLDALNNDLRPFAELNTLEQIGILEGQDIAGAEFFGVLFAHTMEGVYGHPVYGGNKNFIAWTDLCYEGDVHGVRFPGGHDPAAADQPWRVYGGYAPEEMIAPGTCPTKGGGT